MKAKTRIKKIANRYAREAEYWADKSHDVRHKDSKAKALQLVLGYVGRMSELQNGNFAYSATGWTA